MAVLYDPHRTGNEDWPSYQRLVIDKLEGLEESVEALKEEMVTMRVEMATQKTKMSMIGAGTGLIAAAAAEFIWRVIGGTR